MRAQLVDVELRGIDDPVSNGANRLQMAAFSAERRTYGRVGSERMRTARFAVAPQQRRVGGFKEDHHGGNHPLDRLDDGGKSLEFGTFADVDDQRGAADFGRLHGQFGEARNQVDGQIVDAVIAQIFKSLECRSLPGPAQAGDDDEFRTGLACRGRGLAWRLLGRAPGFLFDFLSHLAGMVAEFAEAH